MRLDRQLAVAAAIAQANVVNGAARVPCQTPLQPEIGLSIGGQAKGAVLQGAKNCSNMEIYKPFSSALGGASATMIGFTGSASSFIYPCPNRWAPADIGIRLQQETISLHTAQQQVIDPQDRLT